MTSEVRIVLVEPSHPGNIGSVARAMKNMALEDLVLVRPRTPFPHAEALALAAGADDVLARARTVDTLAEALADCAFVAATTARERSYHWDILTPRDVAARIGALDERTRAALLFGPERYGLSNEDLIACNVLVRIPANPLYASLNLAMSVQLIAYEIYVAREQPASRVQLEQPLASGAELELFYRHLQEVLAEIRFEDRTGYLMQRVRRLFNRAQVDANELNILRGILSAVQEGRNQGRRRLSAQMDPP
ncbi:MAG TPA: RNA methyltransferase [Steroidobacteraceae bacterium]|nr:RNA methyltransferase [Steroidobacteraceae bacterium]